MSKLAFIQKVFSRAPLLKMTASSWREFRLESFGYLSAVATIFFAALAAANEELIRSVFLINASTCALVAIFSFVQLRRSKFVSAAIAQAMLMFFIGASFIPMTSFAVLSLSTFALIAACHLIAASTKFRFKAQKFIELLVALTAGSLLSGVLLTKPWVEPQTPGMALLLVVAAIIFFQWRTYSVFSKLDRQSETVKFGNLQDAIERMGTGIIRFGPDGSADYASEYAAEILSCERFQLAGSGFSRRVHTLDKPIFLKLISDAAHEQKSGAVEVRVRVESKNEHGIAPQYNWLEVSVAGSTESGSRVKPEIVAAIRDVTARKERHDQITHAMEVAEQAAQTKSRFLATIGHELRTPLNAIVGFSEMMTNKIGGEISDAHVEYAEHIRSSGRHLLDAVNMLLDMSKIEAGKFELQLDEFDAAHVIAPTVKMLETQANQKNVTLKTSLAEHLPPLRADERAFRQVLINLLSNAIKFSHQDTQIEINLHRQNRQLVLTVSDQGVGMDPHDAARVGEPFYQAGAGLNRKFEGTGLGLSIVRGLIDLHDGQMQVSSELNVGTKVSIFLPLRGPKTSDKVSAKIHSLATNTPQPKTLVWKDRKSKAS